MTTCAIDYELNRYHDDLAAAERAEEARAARIADDVTELYRSLATRDGADKFISNHVADPSALLTELLVGIAGPDKTVCSNAIKHELMAAAVYIESQRSAP